MKQQFVLTILILLNAILLFGQQGLEVEGLIKSSVTAGATGLDLSSSDAYADLRQIRNTLSPVDNDLYFNFFAGVGSEIFMYADNGLKFSLNNTRAEFAGVNVEMLQSLTVNQNASVVGSLSKGSGSFKIDHPLDPENKYLYHSFVESPDMMNVYNGNVTTNSDGRAVVTLPDYFESLNRDFRYQLTAIGTFAQLIVEKELSDNSFVIASSIPNVKVSWLITGIRQDAFANENRIPNVVEKGEEEKGLYLHPSAFGHTEDKSVFRKEK